MDTSLVSFKQYDSAYEKEVLKVFTEAFGKTGDGSLSCMYCTIEK